MPETLRQGMIVRAIVRPPRGEPKNRPAVVYSPDAVLATSSTVDIVAITSSFYPDDPNLIPLPWSPQGNSVTRLQKPSCIALTFTDTISKADVAPTTGFAPRRQLAD